VGQNLTVNSMTFNTPFAGTYTVSGNQITLGGASITANAHATISSNIAGVSGLTKTGAGTLSLTGTLSYTGTTAVNAGVLKVQGHNAFGANANVTLNGGSCSSASVDSLSWNQPRE